MSDESEHDEALDRLIHDVDLDGLVRLVDARCAAGDWAGLLRLRDRCAAANRLSRTSRRWTRCADCGIRCAGTIAASGATTG